MIRLMLQLLLNTSGAALTLALLLRLIPDASPGFRLTLCWTALWCSLGCAFTIHWLNVGPFEVASPLALYGFGISQAAAVVWIAGAFGLAGKSWIAWRKLAGIRNRSTAPESSELAATLRGEGNVPVRVSDEIRSPAVIGFLQPMIVVPRDLELSPEEWRSVLRHERAHVDRRDPLWNLAQNFVETLLFFSPGVWWISRMIRREREHAADDRVVQELGDPLPLLEALVQIASSPCSSLATSLMGSGGYLLQRTRRLLSPAPIRNPVRGTLMLTLALLVSVQLLLPSLGGSMDSSGQIRLRRIERTVIVRQ